jgi:hypothetical protein
LLPRLRGVGQTRPGRFRTRLRVREGLVAGRSPFAHLTRAQQTCVACEFLTGPALPPVDACVQLF